MSDRAKNDRSDPVSIETLLTLGIAAAILLAAAVIRLVVLGLLEIGFKLAGRDTAWLHPFRNARVPGERPRRQRAPLRPKLEGGLGVARRELHRGLGFTRTEVVPRIKTGGAATAAVVLLVIATLAGWAVVLGREVGRGGRGASAWLGPRLSSGLAQARRGAHAAAAWIRPRAVVALATLQHLARVVYERSSEWLDTRREERSTRVGGEDGPDAGPAPQPPRVIDLDRDWDPLTDPLPPDERVTTRL